MAVSQKDFRELPDPFDILSGKGDAKKPVDHFEEQRQLAQKYEVTFMSPTGIDVLKDLAKFCGADDSCFDDGNPHRTSFLLGQRNVYLRIRYFLETNFKK